jgi:hypothetical protein
MQKEISVSGKTYIVRELLAKEVDAINFEDKAQSNKQQVMISTGITEEEYNSLTWNARTQIFKAINEVNGLGNFQIPTI